MQNQINLYGTYSKEKKKIQFNNIQALKDWMNTLDDGENIVVKFNISKNYKTARQVRLVYSCLRQLSRELGYTVEECKMLMKLSQGLCASHLIEGTDITFCKSISEMTISEINDFIMKIDIWALNNLGQSLLSKDDKTFLQNVK